MFKILEQNGIDNENIDGGAFNNFAAGNRDGVLGGVLSECAFAAEGNTVSIGTGVLIIHGIRVKIEATETIALSSFPNTDTRYQIVARINLENKTPSFSLDVRSPSTVIQDELYQSNNGIYEVEIGRFTHSREGRIIELTRTIDTIYGASPSGALSIGDVQAYDLDPGMPPEADVTKRMENGKELLDFSFGIPKAAGSFTPNGSYAGLGAGNIIAGLLTNEDLHNFLGADYWGKTYYAVGGNTVQNKPDGVNSFFLEILRGGSTTTIHRLTASADTSGESISPNIYIEQYVTSWQDWEEVMTNDGIYPAVKVGALSLSSAVGSPNKPVYFSADGVPVACGNSLAVDITGNAQTAEKAKKLDTIQVGSSSQPVFFNAEGVPVICDDVPSKRGSYEFFNAGSANKLATTKVGSSTQPVYFNSDGIPVACSGVATKANVNSVSMVPYGGQATTLSALESGGVYNITANGFLRIAYQTTAADNFINMKQVDSAGNDMWGALCNGLKSYGSGYPYIYMPVASGDHIKVDFSSSVKIIQVQIIKVKAV